MRKSKSVAMLGFLSLIAMAASGALIGENAFAQTSSSKRNGEIKGGSQIPPQEYQVPGNTSGTMGTEGTNGTNETGLNGAGVDNGTNSNSNIYGNGANNVNPRPNSGIYGSGNSVNGGYHGSHNGASAGTGINGSK